MEATGKLEIVFEASYQRLVAQLLVACGSQQEAEDAVQEAFVKAIAQGERWDHVENPEAWLRTVAINGLRTRWKRGQVLRRLVPRVPGPRQPLEPTPDRVAVEAALDRLDQDLRAVVALYYLVDLPVGAVAAELGIPEGTVKSRLARARRLLGAKFTDREESDHVRPA